MRKIILSFVILCIISYCIFLQLASPTFYESDSYYHIAVSRFIKDLGFHYKFHWAQLSVYKDYFSDSGFLFHLFNVPFLSLSNDIVMAGKYAIIFYNILFILVLVFILRKYLPDHLVSCFLLLPFLSATFTTYFLYLRSVSLANIFTILGIYFLINKKLAGLLIISLLYPLTHISFPTILIFALVCEIIRYVFHKEFYFRNVYVAAIGIMVGCFIHPNFPNNFIYLHFLYSTADYLKKGIDLGLGSELFSYPTARVFLENFALFFTINIILWMAFLSRVKISFTTAVWAACANFYLALAINADRYWYPANALFFIFFAAYTKDWIESKKPAKTAGKINAFIVAYAVIAVIFLPASLNSLRANMELNTKMGVHYKKAGLWMKDNIPAGETIYHNYWSDPDYFICFNPKNDYLVVLDPVNMYYRYPRIFLLYRDLSRGMINKPYEALKEVFKVKYGYTRNDNFFYVRIKKSRNQFKILYEDDLGIIFKLLDNSSIPAH